MTASIIAHRIRVSTPDGAHSYTALNPGAIVRIGAHVRADLQLPGANVARVHCVLEQRDGVWNLLDLGTGRGTYRNGERIARAALRPGDEIRVGDHTLVYEQVTVTPDINGIVPDIAPVSDATRYARRFLSRPTRTDGSIAYAVLLNDTVLADELIPRPKPITVGAADDATIGILDAALGGESLPIVDVDDSGDAWLVVGSNMQADVYVDDRQVQVPAEGMRIPFTGSTRARYRFGDVTILVRRATKASIVAPSATFGIDRTRFVVASAVAHAALLTLVMMWISPVGEFDADQFSMDDEMLSLVTQTFEPEVPEPIPEELADATETDGSEGSASGVDPSDDGEPHTSDDESPEHARLGDPQSEEEAAAAAQERGVLAMLNPYANTAILGGDNSYYDVVGDQLAHADLGAGTQMGLSQFAGTRGRPGDRNGVGGGPFVLGDPTGNGRCVGEDCDGDNWRSVSSRPRDGGTRVQVVPEDGDADIQGCLDSSIIRRVVREHRREIRACYEDGLRQTPELEGRVVVRWTIAPDGTVAVASIRESDLASTGVESCITRRVQRWRFPEVASGGIIRVSYPFVFSQN